MDNKIKGPRAKTLAWITGGVLNFVFAVLLCRKHPEFGEAQVTKIEERMNKVMAYPEIEVADTRPLSIRIVACIFAKGPLRPGSILMKNCIWRRRS